jgi:hypothetical protein
MSNYKERRQIALDDAEKYLKNHVIVDEPVRSFRFHMHYVDRKYDKGVTVHRPGFLTFRPTQSVSFAYNSTYAFSLTWQPGHVTIVGDLGELTVVHYHAMSTLEVACHWLQSSDFQYLLSKTKEKREFQRDATIDDIWREISEEAHRAVKEIAAEVAAHERDKPKWRKRDGMSKVDFEWEMEGWEANHPRKIYRFIEVDAPDYLNRNLWRQCERDGWSIPDGFHWAFRAWKELRDTHYHSIGDDPNVLLTEEGMDQLKGALEDKLDGLAEDEIVGWVYRDLGLEDYSPVREYSSQAFFQIAAIQHGCRMILDQLARITVVAA